ncbi:hypothetical protein HAX54_042462, partial [Datura stramonium]|nr:hypothetical protein [Datura stramonium]
NPTTLLKKGSKTEDMMIALHLRKKSKRVTIRYSDDKSFDLLASVGALINEKFLTSHGSSFYPVSAASTLMAYEISPTVLGMMVLDKSRSSLSTL